MNNKQIHDKAKKMLAGLFTCALLGGVGYAYHDQITVHADDPMYAFNYSDPDTYGSTASRYIKDYAGTEPHDSEVQTFLNHWESGPHSNEESGGMPSSDELAHTPNPVDLLVVFYYYDKTDPSDTSQFCNAQHNMYNKGDTVHIHDLFTSLGHGTSWSDQPAQGYALSGDHTVGNYSDFTINNNKTMYVPVTGHPETATIQLMLYNSHGGYEGQFEVDGLTPGQSLNVSQWLQQNEGDGYQDADPDQIITVPTRAYMNDQFNVTLKPSSLDHSDSDNETPVTLQLDNYDDYGNEIKTVTTRVSSSDTTVNISNIAEQYGYTPVESDDIRDLNAFGGNGDNYFVILVHSKNNSETQPPNSTMDNNTQSNENSSDSNESIQNLINQLEQNTSDGNPENTNSTSASDTNDITNQQSIDSNNIDSDYSDNDENNSDDDSDYDSDVTYSFGYYRKRHHFYRYKTGCYVDNKWVKYTHKNSKFGYEVKKRHHRHYWHRYKTGFYFMHHWIKYTDHKRVFDQ